MGEVGFIGSFRRNFMTTLPEKRDDEEGNIECVTLTRLEQEVSRPFRSYAADDFVNGRRTTFVLFGRRGVAENPVLRRSWRPYRVNAILRTDAIRSSSLFGL
jgi:hypothetical protein